MIDGPASRTQARETREALYVCRCNAAERLSVHVHSFDRIANQITGLQVLERRIVLVLKLCDRLPDGDGLRLVGHPFLDEGSFPGFETRNVFDFVRDDL